MIEKSDKGFIIGLIKMAFKTITPWKMSISVWEGDKGYNDYANGWNDCIKEIKKNRAKYIKHLEKSL